jgi:Alkylmercury lyase
MPARRKGANDTVLDDRLRLFIYRQIVRQERAPKVVEMASKLSRPQREIRAALERLSQGHAIVTQQNGELWRAAPFSAIPTAFPVEIGKRSWYGNCIWDALGIPAMLHKDGRVLASCGCCNMEMTLTIKKGSLQQTDGIIHIAVPARQWYEDIVFT